MELRTIWLLNTKTNPARNRRYVGHPGGFWVASTRALLSALNNVLNVTIDLWYRGDLFKTEISLVVAFSHSVSVYRAQ